MNLLDHKDVRVIEGNNKVVILNSNNNNWVKMDDKAYDEFMNKNTLEDILDKYGILNNKNDKKTNNKFKSVYFAITNKCNLSCEFCSMRSNPYVSEEMDLNIDDIKNKVIPKIKSFNPKNILITGGEPFIRKDIIELIDLIHSEIKSSELILQSNGLLITEDIINKLSGKINQIEISIENLFEDDGLYKRMTKVFDLLKEKDISMSFSFVVDNKNKIYIKDAIDIVVKYDANFLMRLVSPAGEALYNNVGYLSDQEVLTLYREIISYIIEKNYSETKLMSLLLTHILPKKSCGAYGDVLSIYPSGETFMCPTLCEDKFSLGNIIENSSNELITNLNEKLQDSEIKDLLIVDNIKECEECEVKNFCTGICLSKRNNTDNTDWISSGCTLAKLLINFILFYYQNKKDNKYNLNLLLDYINENIKLTQYV